MMKFLYIYSLASLFSLSTLGQSLEILPGTERIFTDAQWLEVFDEEKRWSLFSRSRATVDYQDNTDLFTGAYLNYTSKMGLGATLLGRVSSRGAGSDAGSHFFKAGNQWMIYALASIALSSELSYSWFSILRFTPKLSGKWRVYSSLELFSNFEAEGHVASVQRIRVGLDRAGFQFGLGLNLSGLGKTYSTTDSNLGVFIRKQF